MEKKYTFSVNDIQDVTTDDSAEFAIRDAIKLCNMGIQLRENN